MRIYCQNSLIWFFISTSICLLFNSNVSAMANSLSLFVSDYYLKKGMSTECHLAIISLKGPKVDPLYYVSPNKIINS